MSNNTEQGAGDLTECPADDGKDNDAATNAIKSEPAGEEAKPAEEEAKSAGEVAKSAGKEAKSAEDSENESEDDSDDEFSNGWEEEEEEDAEGVESAQALFMKLSFHLARLEERTAHPALPDSVRRLEWRGADGRQAEVYLIGTAHFSEVSNREVAALISTLKPDRIVLELDHSRSNILFMDEARLMSEAKSYNFAMFRRLAAQQGVSYGLMHYLLLRMSASLVEQLGMAPGGEFRAAAEAASRVPGCTLFYGDRPVGLTLRRAFSQLSIFSRIRLAFALLSSLGPVSRDDVERLKQSDLVEAMVKELEAQFPILGRVFVDERDRYLSRAIFDFASLPLSHSHLLGEAAARQPVVLVAVVGMGHVAGIERYWAAAEAIDRRELCAIPEPSRTGVLFRRAIKWAALGGLFYGGYCLLTRLASRLW